MTEAGSRVTLCLVAHTNVGKTTLARTLLGRDIGEVRDAPHVTDFAERHALVTTPAGDVLDLWDTPGFGDSARLARRMRQADRRRRIRRGVVEDDVDDTRVSLILHALHRGVEVLCSIVNGRHNGHEGQEGLKTVCHLSNSLRDFQSGRLIIMSACWRSRIATDQGPA